MSTYWKHAEELRLAVTEAMSELSAVDIGVAGVHQERGLMPEYSWSLALEAPGSSEEGIQAIIDQVFVVTLSFSNRKSPAQYAEDVDIALLMIRGLLRPFLLKEFSTLVGIQFREWREDIVGSIHTMELEFEADCRAVRTEEFLDEDLVFYVPGNSVSGQDGSSSMPLRVLDTIGGRDLFAYSMPYLGGGFDQGQWRGLLTGRNAHTIFHEGREAFFCFWYSPLDSTEADYGQILGTPSGEISVSQVDVGIHFSITATGTTVSGTVAVPLVSGKAYWVFAHFSSGALNCVVHPYGGSPIEVSLGDVTEEKMSLASAALADSEIRVLTIDGEAPSNTGFVCQLKFGACDVDRALAMTAGPLPAGIPACYFSGETITSEGGMGSLGLDGTPTLGAVGKFDTMTEAEFAGYWGTAPAHAEFIEGVGLRFYTETFNADLLESGLLSAVSSYTYSAGGSSIVTDWEAGGIGETSIVLVWNTLYPFTSLNVDEVVQRTLKQQPLSLGAGGSLKSLSCAPGSQSQLTMHSFDIVSGANYPAMVGDASQEFATRIEGFGYISADLVSAEIGATHVPGRVTLASKVDLTLPRVFTLAGWFGDFNLAYAGNNPFGIWGGSAQVHLSVWNSPVTSGDPDAVQGYFTNITVMLSIGDGHGGLLEGTGHLLVVEGHEFIRTMNHVGAVVNLDTKTIAFYLNGAPLTDYTSTSTDGPVGEVSGAVVVNMPAMGTQDCYFRGVALANRALEPAELQTWANQTRPKIVGEL